MPGRPETGEGEVTLEGLAGMFPDEGSACAWFEARIWPEGRRCPRCGSGRTCAASHRTMPYWCSSCRSYFSVKTATVMEASNLPLRKWLLALYLDLASPEGVWPLELCGAAGISVEAAWFTLERIRAALRGGPPDEADNTPTGRGGRSTEATGEPGTQKPDWAALLPAALEGSGLGAMVHTDEWGTHQLRPEAVERLQQQTEEIAARKSLRGLGSVDRIGVVASRMTGKRLRYTDLAG